MVDIENLYARYGGMVCRRCRAMLRNDDDARDAAQEVFAHLLRAGENVHGLFPSSLLWRMATNECLNRIRQANRRGAETAEVDSVDPAGERGFEKVEANMVIRQVLAAESEENRGLLYMYHVDEMTLAEIGQVLGMSVSGVRKRLRGIEARARRRTV